MTVARATLRGWLIWGTLLTLALLVLVHSRPDVDQSHAVLVLLLVVLGGSVAGGRALGFTLALLAFLLIDYFFQPPFGEISVGKPLDGVLLIAFIATAGVTTELLTRARQEADAARQREGEVESLSRLGAETLRHARPEQALDAIARLVRDTIGASSCSILAWDDAHEPFIAGTSHGDADLPAEVAPDERAAAARIEAGTPHWDIDAQLPAPLLALPLRADARTIGVLLVRGQPVPALDESRRRYLEALAYYAALGVERMRLVKEAGHLEALREADRAKDQVLASVSHDLRTPLTTIKVLAQGAESRGEPSAAAIVEQADRLARMVGDLLELSRLRAGGFAVTRELNTAEDVVGAALRRAEGILGGRTIVPHVDLDAPALVGEFDFVHTLRIVGNLLDNALRFTPPGGVVDLRVGREEGWLTFTVADRGAGVPARERERIFESFYRPTDAMPDAGQAGLGLSIARTLAEAQGGTLAYAERRGGGSEFTLRLVAADLTHPQPGELE